MKQRWVETGINRCILINYLAGKCPFSAPNGQHHERSINVLASLAQFDAILTCWVSNIYQRTNIFVNFLLQRQLAFKNHKSLRWREDQRRNEESFYSLCKEAECNVC
jgi:hypothetical protein